MHSSTAAGSTPARRTLSATTSAPSAGAVKSLRLPRNLPVGVRTALMMTDSRIASSGSARRWRLRRELHFDVADDVRPEQFGDTGRNDGTRPRDLASPILRSGHHPKRSVARPGQRRGAGEARPRRNLPNESDLRVGRRLRLEQTTQRTQGRDVEPIHKYMI